MVVTDLLMDLLMVVALLLMMVGVVMDVVEMAMVVTDLFVVLLRAPSTETIRSDAQGWILNLL
jgi:hypothetical protein